MSSLGNSIKNFESAAKSIAQLLNLWLLQKYSEELTMAAANGIFNSLYKYSCKVLQNAQINEEVLENNLS
jgi:hypothetical protein